MTIFVAKVKGGELEVVSGLLQFYIDLNAGGTVHGQTEIARVRSHMLDSKPASVTA
ncbi:hypothetical protein [Comamonas testosteroni]|uniref:hypothetical protein n=1 Tax=Comamonas testosteroni TaxID=285 RepID=UPI0012D3627A|nr:hypothetical protein [Comamonas testosteroni]